MGSERNGFPGEVEVALRALRLGTELGRRVQATLSKGGAHEKPDRSPVTVADYGVQAVVCRELERAFPGDAVMGEENAADLLLPENRAIAESVAREVGRATGVSDLAEIVRSIDRARSHGGRGRFWALDPIDGTKGFLRGEHYAIALALLEGAEVVVGALACPSLPCGGELGALFVAVRGCGARRYPLSGGSGEPIRVSKVGDARAARLLESVEAAHGSHGAHDRIRRQLGVDVPGVRLDSQAKYAVVAAGDAEIYLRMPTSEEYRENVWDHAAGALLVEEAGGRVSDAHGRPLDFTLGKKLVGNVGVVATNGALHETVLAAIRATGGPRP
jgi:HAL2 family 3'(2'),5'-bisphosphate nucleotidase